MRSDCGAETRGGLASGLGRAAGRVRVPSAARALKAMKALARLAKFRISALAGLSAATGHILAANGISAQTAAVASGVFLIACGSCALNQIQDRTIDSLMLRTRHRPIPAGLIAVPSALALSLALTAAGSAALYVVAGPVPLGLALLAAAWYNGVYTYLKRYTAFAAIPGGVVGAIPPAVGWAAGGGSLFHPQILSLMVFMFIWQVPHFWLLLLDNREDYDRAGLPSLTNVFRPSQLGRMIFIWILAAVVSCMLVPLLGAARPMLVVLLLAGAALWVLPSAARHLGGPGGGRAPGGASAVYVRLNVYALMVLCALSAGGILNGMY